MTQKEGLGTRYVSRPPILNHPFDDCLIRRLDLDVFRVVLSSLLNQDLVSVSHVSRLLQDEAWKEMLTRPIRLRRVEDVESFHQFVGADPTRGNLVRDLTFEHIVDGRDSLVPSDHFMLVILFSTPYLRCLRIYRCETLFCGTLLSRLESVVSSLFCIREFCISTGRKSYYDNILEIVLKLPPNTLNQV